ncbi:ATP-binding protein [Anthocerotibacter panamensis]|uniref:ATP-binding protein n=1 Tax=Anthocerotibacter panamensis TaxID=2857077 RepID=UPI001C401B66|nr:ATP-binding protein [Anthocerotibacter panamensis]
MHPHIVLEDRNDYQCLQAAIHEIYQALVRIAQQRQNLPISEVPTPEQVHNQPFVALEHLCETFNLSAFERDVLLLCAGMELHTYFRTLCAVAQDNSLPYPTFHLAISLFPNFSKSALTPKSPLLHWHLIEVGEGPLFLSPLRIERTILYYLMGEICLDSRLTGIVQPIPPDPTPLQPSHQALVTQILAVWRQSTIRLPIVQLCGADSAVMRAIASSACTQAGYPLSVVAAHHLPVDPQALTAWLQCWERQARLTGDVLLVECEDTLMTGSPHQVALELLAERLAGRILVAGRERQHLRHRPLHLVDVQPLTRAEQLILWQQTLGPLADTLNGQMETLVFQFNLTQTAIQSAGEAVVGQLHPSETPHELSTALWSQCRAQARPRLESLAQRIASTATWEDLVLPEAQLQTLREIVACVQQRTTVYETWGLARSSPRGLGISALFAGGSGTGKTLSAEVLAGELHLDLYRIDLSTIVSKYIGETEKNLSRIFDAAEAGGAILLFDEADALFGKRSEVKDSHDRHANIEVSYLLQRMEAYQGLAILTTNLKDNLDTAFMRRIRFTVRYPFPDFQQRAKIWEWVFPKAVPTEGLEVEKLARLNVTGGSIRNIALNAAFLAAQAREQVGMKHLLRAARTEYSKTEKMLSDTEVKGWI